MGLKTLNSKYTLIGVDELGVQVLRPIIPIEITYYKTGKPDASSRKFALIDSGADRCILKAEIGEELGIDIRKGTPYKFGGVADGKELVGYVHNVGLEIGQFPMYTASVVFTYDMSDISDCLLGEHGFFDHFAIKLDYKKKDIIIKNR